ncbi:Mg(2+) transport ATPase, P-type [Escherichia coli]|uniref:Mg(2+) transport ATPase, P-type n=1 Tax=Escherichia coli TaxID=562 RepID=A0A377AQ07_ECOLX|nr:Mg(2+) transport ATPase, P-type [Escherichia coli]
MGSGTVLRFPVAVGLTPEMLPMIVTSTLARGAVKLSKQKVIVKHLDAIQNFGAMDILCTDKTGTLTQDKIVLENHTDISGKTSERVLHSAWLNSHYQTGLKNLLDTAVLEGTDEESARSLASRWQKIDEIPFDFERRRMSVVVAENTEHISWFAKVHCRKSSMCVRRCVTMARLCRSMTSCCVRLSGLLIR